MTVRITDVRAILTQPGASRLVVVKVETSDDGLYGVGCATFTQRVFAVEAAIERHLKPFLIGRDVDRIERDIALWLGGGEKQEAAGNSSDDTIENCPDLNIVTPKRKKGCHKKDQYATTAVFGTSKRMVTKWCSICKKEHKQLNISCVCRRCHFCSKCQTYTKGNRHRLCDCGRRCFDYRDGRQKCRDCMKQQL